MDKAGGNPSVSSAAVQSGFDLANSIGAYLGGMVIAGGFGLLAQKVIGASLAVLGLGLALTSGLLDRRSRRTADRSSCSSSDEVKLSAVLPSRGYSVFAALQCCP